ncbi:MAG: acyl-CoA dehydrogenase family protein [Acidimicrobiales bacterium]|nr:acyl-CoA dehydrogenase family protein [Acidimicrobiales bacterium]
MSAADSTYHEILEVATKASERSDGATPLTELGWADILAGLGDPDAFAAAFAIARAQGRALTHSTALGSLAAQPYLEATDLNPGRVVAAIARESRLASRVDVLIGDSIGCLVLVDRPGEGAILVDTDALTLLPIDLPGRLVAHQVSFDGDSCLTEISEDRAAAARVRSVALTRIAAASEMLGAAETVLAMAVQYATDREQFGRPIGTFQAVRHLLAWAETDVVALDAVVRQAIRLGDTAPERFDAVLKALAGRNGRQICERALQTFGGIGFTAEHDHHHFHSRVLFLDGLAGSSAVLTHELGTWLRTTGVDPAYPAAVLAGPD